MEEGIEYSDSEKQANVFISVSQRKDSYSVLGIPIPFSSHWRTFGNYEFKTDEGRESHGHESNLTPLDCLADLLVNAEFRREDFIVCGKIGSINATFKNIQNGDELPMTKLLEMYARSENAPLVIERNYFL